MVCIFPLNLIERVVTDGISGIAGCLAERVPVLHIVGSPSTKLQVCHNAS